MRTTKKTTEPITPATPRAKKVTTETPAALPKPIVVPKQMTVSLISQRYELAGWALWTAPSGLMCDFLAIAGNKCHMIKIIDSAALDNNPQVTPNLGENDYIRFATQLGAQPVYVAVTAKAKRGGDVDYTTTFRQAGTGNPVIISR